MSDNQIERRSIERSKWFQSVLSMWIENKLSYDSAMSQRWLDEALKLQGLFGRFTTQFPESLEELYWNNVDALGCFNSVESARDWYDFADKSALADEFRNGPKDMDCISHGVWGIKGCAVVCIGDYEHMRKVATKRFHDRFERDGRCPMAKHSANNPPLPSVKDRLIRDGYL